MDETKCPVCGSSAKQFDDSDYGERQRFSCVQCEDFAITKTSLGMIRSRRDRALVSHAIFQMQEREQVPTLNSALIKEILNSHQIPDPTEQAVSFLEFVARVVKDDHGKRIEIRVPRLRAITGALSDDSVSSVLSYLQQRNLVTVSDYTQHLRRVSLTLDGWAELHASTKMNVGAKQAFMAMPFGVANLDHVYRTCFKAAVRETGFELKRIDESPQAGLIDNRLRVEIRRSRFLISELTNGNLGAYWEAGFAEGIGIPVIYTCEEGFFELERPHFDTSHHQMVIWKPEDLASAASQLKAVIRATLPAEANLSDTED